MINLKNQKGLSFIKLIFITGVIIFAIIFLNSNSKTKQSDEIRKSTSDYSYLLNNKPTSEQISSAKTIDYRSLYKGANTLKGNYYRITGEIVQATDGGIYHINMTKTGEYYTYYTDRIQITVIGTPSEILMEGDIVSFVGESLGNYTYTAIMGNSNTVPALRVYAENLKVIGHTD